MLYEWLDVRRSGWHKLNVHSMGPEVWSHLDLVHVACNHCSNGCEGLKRFTIGIRRPRRVLVFIRFCVFRGAKLPYKFVDNANGIGFRNPCLLSSPVI